MARTSSPEFYSPEEIKSISEAWLKIKKQIDNDPLFGYYVDKDAEYRKYLNNTNLKMLFGHAARLYHQIHLGEEMALYPREQELIVKVYREIIENGYYSRSKFEEKKKRTWLGKIVSRQ